MDNTVGVVALHISLIR